MADNKYQFYEIVKIQSDDTSKAEINGQEGAVTGMAQNDDGMWGYSVHIYSIDDTWYLLEKELAPTGKMDKHETFHSGESITVEVDPETGEGRIKD